MYISTDRTFWFEDHITKKIKSAWHVVFDEAHYLSNNVPPYTKELMDLLEEQLNVSSPTPTPAPTLQTPYSQTTYTPHNGTRQKR